MARTKKQIEVPTVIDVNDGPELRQLKIIELLSDILDNVKEINLKLDKTSGGY